MTTNEKDIASLNRDNQQSFTDVSIGSIDKALTNLNLNQNQKSKLFNVSFVQHRKKTTTFDKNIGNKKSNSSLTEQKTFL